MPPHEAISSPAIRAAWNADGVFGTHRLKLRRGKASARRRASVGAKTPTEGTLNEQWRLAANSRGPVRMPLLLRVLVRTHIEVGTTTAGMSTVA